MTKNLHTIAYTSESLIPPEKQSEEIKDIILTARDFNARHNITGVLLFKNNRFLQIIEGSQKDLRALMKNIESDPRHKNVEYLADKEIERRGFTSWSMDFFDMDDDEKFSFENLCKIRRGLQENTLTSAKDILDFYNALLQ